MSVLMSAPGVVLDGPLPRPPEYALMSVAEDVTAQQAASRGGATVVPYPDGRAEDIISNEDPCVEGSPAGKLVPEALVILDLFPSFDAYLGEICTAYNIGDWDAWRERANRAFLARENWILERQLADGSFASGVSPNVTPTLGNIAAANSTVLNGGASTPVRTALAYLEDYLAQIGSQGVLHLARPVVAYLGFENFETDGGVLRTATGTPVISGSGYVGAVEPDSQVAAAAGQSWIYASGVPQFAREGQVFSLPETLSEALDREENIVIYRAERGLWVGWDGQFSAAVLADWSP